MKVLVRLDTQLENLSMGKTEKNLTESLAWLKYSLNPKTEQPIVSDWDALLDFADKQKITGVCLPSQCPENLEKDLLLQWIGQVQLIESQNKLVNTRVGMLFEMLENAGFPCVLLKGQGNAGMYPNPLVRCSGDIDVWIDGEEKNVFQYVKSLFPETEESFKHIHFPIFNDVSVDLHITPLKFYSGRYNRRLQNWIEKQKNEQFSNKKVITGIDKNICVPTCGFNVVYQLGHMLIHLFDEGVGLRQVVDYFYVLKEFHNSGMSKNEVEDVLKELGMNDFAKAIMWIESEVLGLGDEYCIVVPDERSGKILLKDILEGGNFGHYSNRYKGRTGFVYKGLVKVKRNIKLVPFALREGLARVLFRAGTAIRYQLKLCS